MKFWFLFNFLCISLFCDPNYTLCIDGGGSKTELQVLDQNGQLLFSNTLDASSNINVVGEDGVRATLHALVENHQTHLATLLPNCRIIAGLAGVGLPQNREIVISLFEEWGVDRSQILVTTDAELALQLVNDNGIVLICGTGSICFGKNHGNLYRVGGLGRVLGDEGSGYQMGLQALKAALADEYGWGTPTQLTSALKEFFQIDSLKTLIPALNQLEIPSSKVARCAPIVFELAWGGDLAAKEIIENAAQELGQALSLQLAISGLSSCEVHLWGGVFKSKYANEFLQLILDHVNCEKYNLRCINYSHHMPASLFVLKNCGRL